MNRLLRILASAAFGLCSALPAWAGEVRIIANSGSPLSEISGEELKRIFLMTRTSLEDGSRVEPVVGRDGATHEEFVKKYLGKTTAALEIYYRGLVFTGKGTMPKSFASDAQIAAYVAKTKGAIGYVSVGTNASGVKTIEVR